MKFVCTRENLSYVLNIVSGIAGKHAHLPILSNILFTAFESRVDLVGTNLEIAVKGHLRAKVEKPGSFTVPAKTLSDYVGLLSDEQVTIALDGEQLHITCGNSSTKIKGTPPDEFPVIPDVEEKHGYTIDVEQFRQGFGRVVIAAAKNEIRPELSGVYCRLFSEAYSGLVLAATDSYRLAEKRIPVDQGKDRVECIIPGRAVYEMIRLVGAAANQEGEHAVRFCVSDNQVALRYDNFEMTTRLVDGSYPDYTQIIPAEFKTTAVFRLDDMIKKIKAASLFTTTGVNAVSFDLNVEDHTIGISSTSTQTGEHTSQMEAELSGEESSILLNHRYILDGLQHMETEEAEFCMNGSDAPCLFRPKGATDYLYIVMPIRQ